MGALAAEISYDNPPGISGQESQSVTLCSCQPGQARFSARALLGRQLASGCTEADFAGRAARDAIEMRDAKDRADRG